MKRIMLTLIITASCFIMAVSLPASYSAESSLGTWLVPKGDAKVTIFQCGNNTCGKISWLKTPDDLDVNNPDPGRRTNKLLGMTILWGFNFNGSEWVDGRIYDPDSGSTYKCKMWLEGSDMLNVKGYVGISIIGRAETWTRVK